MWITEGDIVDLRDMVDAFHFEQGRIVVHFAPYAVGPSVEGEHTVEIPISKLESVRPRFARLVAGGAFHRASR